MPIEKIPDESREKSALETFDEIMDYKRQINKLKAELDDLKGENIDLINHADFIEQGKIKKVIDGFKAEIKELKNGSDVAYMEILHRSNDKLLAENKQLQNHVDKYGALRHDELQAENDRLIKQVSSNRGNSSTSHTIQKEIAEYMDNNDKCKDARMFLFPIEEFKDGEHNGGYFYWDDGME